MPGALCHPQVASRIERRSTMRSVVCAAILLTAAVCTTATTDATSSSTTSSITTSTIPTTPATPATTTTVTSSAATTANTTSPIDAEASSTKVKRQFVHHGDNSTSFQLVTRAESHAGAVGRHLDVTSGGSSLPALHRQHHQHHRPLAATSVRSPHGRFTNFRPSPSVIPPQYSVQGTSHHRPLFKNDYDSAHLEQPDHLSRDTIIRNQNHKAAFHTAPERTFHVADKYEVTENDTPLNDVGQNNRPHKGVSYSETHVTVHVVPETKNDAGSSNSKDAVPLIAPATETGSTFKNSYRVNHDSKQSDDVVSNTVHDGKRDEIDESFTAAQHPAVITEDGIQTAALIGHEDLFHLGGSELSLHSLDTLPSTYEESQVDVGENSIVSYDSSYGNKIKNLRNQQANSSPNPGLEVIYENERENHGKQQENFKEVFSTEDLKAVEGKRGVQSHNFAADKQYNQIIQGNNAQDQEKVKLNGWASPLINIHRTRPHHAPLHTVSPILHAQTRAPYLMVYKQQVMPTVTPRDSKLKQFITVTQNKDSCNSQKKVDQTQRSVQPVPIFTPKPVVFRMNPHVVLGFQHGQYSRVPNVAFPQAHVPVRPLVAPPGKPMYPPQMSPALRPFQVPVPVRPVAYTQAQHTFQVKPILNAVPQPEKSHFKNLNTAYLATPVHAGIPQNAITGTKPISSHHTDPLKHVDNTNVYAALLRQKLQFQGASNNDLPKKETSYNTVHEPLKYTTATFQQDLPTSHQSYTFVYPRQSHSQQSQVASSSKVIPVTESGYDIPPPTTRFTFQPADAVLGPGESNLANRAGSRGDIHGRQMYFPALSSSAEEHFAPNSNNNGLSSEEGSNGWKPILRPRGYAFRRSEETIGDMHTDADASSETVNDVISAKASVLNPVTASTLVETTAVIPAPTDSAC